MGPPWAGERPRPATTGPPGTRTPPAAPPATPAPTGAPAAGPPGPPPFLAWLVAGALVGVLLALALAATVVHRRVRPRTQRPGDARSGRRGGKKPADPHDGGCCAATPGTPPDTGVPPGEETSMCEGAESSLALRPRPPALTTPPAAGPAPRRPPVAPP